MEIKSNLRWPGGKSKMIKEISPFFPKYFDKYLEMFCGGCSLGMHIIQNRQIESSIFNDINFDLINYYLVIKNKDQRFKLVNNLIDIKSAYTAEQFTEMFYEIKSQTPNSKLDQAIRFFIINKCGFSGIERSTFSKQAFNKNFSVNSIMKILKIGKLFQEKEVNFTNKDFTEFENLSGYFIYLDPPYFSNRKKELYGKSHLLFNHQRLKALIQTLSAKNKFLLSYDDTPEIRNLYSNFRIECFSKKYSMTNSGGNLCKTGQELLIMNY